MSKESKLVISESLILSFLILEWFERADLAERAEITLAVTASLLFDFFDFYDECSDVYLRSFYFASCLKPSNW